MYILINAKDIILQVKHIYFLWIPIISLNITVSLKPVTERTGLILKKGNRKSILYFLSKSMHILKYCWEHSDFFYLNENSVIRTACIKWETDLMIISSLNSLLPDMSNLCLKNSVAWNFVGLHRITRQITYTNIESEQYEI